MKNSFFIMWAPLFHYFLGSLESIESSALWFVKKVRSQPWKTFSIAIKHLSDSFKGKKFFLVLSIAKRGYFLESACFCILTVEKPENATWFFEHKQYYSLESMFRQWKWDQKFLAIQINLYLWNNEQKLAFNPIYS